MLMIVLQNVGRTVLSASAIKDAARDATHNGFTESKTANVFHVSILRSLFIEY